MPLGCVSSAGLGKARRVDDAAGRYVEFCKSTFRRSSTSRLAHRGRLRARGRLSRSAAGFSRAWRRSDLDRRRARWPQHQRRRRCDASAIPGGAGARARGDLGIALDGDGDRLIMADRDGRLYDGDQLLYVIATDDKSPRCEWRTASSAR